VNVGQTISARFLNGLPPAYSQWYERPPGVVPSGGELFLAGTQQSRCSSGPAQTGASLPARGRGQSGGGGQG
jgi:hypothetical protein